MINSSVYIIASFENGYTQYPDNYAKSIYQKFLANANAKSQIIVHRDKELMYYGYVRKLDKPSMCIGFCVLLNGVMFSNISNLFTIFENAIAEMVSRGDIIGFNERGDIVSTTATLVDKLQEVKNIQSLINNEIDGMKPYIKSLPPVDYSISNTDIKRLSYSDDNDTIIAASCRYAYTYITKGKGGDTATITGYKGVVKKLCKEKDELSSKYVTLRNQYDKLNKQKKQYRNVVILCLIVAFCGIGLSVLVYNLTSTKETLEQSQNDNVQKGRTIKKMQSNITSLNDKLSELKCSLSYEQSKRAELGAELKALTDIYEEKQPLFIESTSFSFTSGRLSFEYYGFYEENVTLSVRAFDGNHSYYNSMSFTIEKGHHSSSIYLSDNLVSSQWYSFELLIDNRIIGGDRH